MSKKYRYSIKRGEHNYHWVVYSPEGDHYASGYSTRTEDDLANSLKTTCKRLSGGGISFRINYRKEIPRHPQLQPARQS